MKRNLFNNIIIKYILKVFLVILLVGLTIPFIYSQEDFEGDVNEIFEINDRRQAFDGTDLSMEMKMITSVPGEDDEVKSLKIFRKDENNKFMIIFTSPITDAGNGYLYIDNNLWFYDSESREFIKKTKSESLGGSDAKSRDVEKPKMTELYNWTYEGTGKVGKIKCYLISGEAAVSDVAYPKTKIWVRQDNYLLVKRQEFSVSDTLSQTVYYLHYTKINFNEEEKYIADKILIKDELEKGKQTLMEHSNISLAELPDNIFTKAYLENQNN
jgi:outer membrane lipoprotein-sorting protein